MIERKIFLLPESEHPAAHVKLYSDDERACSTCATGQAALAMTASQATDRQSPNFTLEAIFRCDTKKRLLGQCGIGPPKRLEVARDYNEEDEVALDTFVKSELGPQATAQYLGVRAKGVKGDAAVYCHAVVLSDPNLIDHESKKLDYDRVAKISTAITNTIEIADNVTLDLASFLRPPADK